jgi:hypothetical protein
MPGSEVKNKFDTGIYRGLTYLTLSVFVLFALFWLCWSLLTWYRLHLHLPWRDTFVVLSRIIPVLQSGAWFTSLDLWFEPHYAAHRIALPRMLIALDLALLKGQNHLLYAAGWASIIATLSVILRPVRSYLRPDSSAWILLAAVAFSFMFAPAHLWNILNPINISWHLTFAFSAIAFWCLLRRDRDIRGLDLCIAWICALLAALSTFGGLITCMLLPFAAARGSRKYLIANLMLAVLICFWYLQGIASDASIASQWTLGDSDAIGRLRESSKAAMAQNSIPHVAWKSLLLLAWPLSQNHPVTGALLVFGALLVLPWWARQWLGSVLGRQRRFQAWPGLCFFLATLCVGISIATQLGRLMEQPNYAHGPSFERYQTIVAIFWISTTGLWVYLLDRRHVPDLVSTLSASIITVLLLVPAGNYLQQEIESNQYAARLYGQGELDELRPESGAKMLRFKPEYLFSFDRYLSANKLAYRVPAWVPSSMNHAPDCRDITTGLSLTEEGHPENLTLRLFLSNMKFLFVRELWVANNGQLVGRLQPQHSADFYAHQLLLSQSNGWQGILSGARIQDGPLQLVARTALADRVLCQLNNKFKQAQD